MLPNTVLQDWANASISGTCPLPLPHVSPLSLISLLVVPGRLSALGAYTGEFGLKRPVLSAVELVTILKVEPGGKVALMARFSSGWALFSRSALSALLSC